MNYEITSNWRGKCLLTKEEVGPIPINTLVFCFEEEKDYFRVYTRKKDWNPTIYTKATNTVEASTVENAYYKIYRAKYDYTVIDYGTGSLNHTRLSYDASGSYFDLDTSMLEKDYMYGVKFVFYENGKYIEQPDAFKFRVS